MMEGRGDMLAEYAVRKKCQEEEEGEDGRSVEEEETENGRPVEGRMMGAREDKTATQPTCWDGGGAEETEEEGRPAEEEVSKIGRPVEGVMMMGA